MKTVKFLIGLFFLSIMMGHAQTAEDLFKPGRIRWMGIDYSHVKLIGDFAQFGAAGEVNISTVKSTYFPAWNQLMSEEPDKYSIKSMLRKDDIIYDLDMVTELNAKTPLETIEAKESPIYSKEDIQKFIRNYGTKQTTGIGAMFIVESLDKTRKEGWYHFILFRFSDNEILIHERVKGEPTGVGIRNYWAGSLLKVINTIKLSYYPKWKTTYVK